MMRRRVGNNKDEIGKWSRKGEKRDRASKEIRVDGRWGPERRTRRYFGSEYQGTGIEALCRESPPGKEGGMDL